MTDLAPHGRPRRNLEAFSSSAQIEAADRLAETLIVAFGQCGSKPAGRYRAPEDGPTVGRARGIRRLGVELESRLSFETGLDERRQRRGGLASASIVYDFELDDQAGQRFRLSEALRDGAVVLVFYRGDW
jgi:hypothetical protein